LLSCAIRWRTDRVDGQHIIVGIAVVCKNIDEHRRIFIRLSFIINRTGIAIAGYPDNVDEVVVCPLS